MRIKGCGDRYPFHGTRYQAWITQASPKTRMTFESTPTDDGPDPHTDDELCPSFCRTLPELIQEAKEEIARDRVHLARLEQRRMASMYTAISSAILGTGSLLLIRHNGITPAACWLALCALAIIILLITHRAVNTTKANLRRVTFWQDTCIDDAYAASRNQPQLEWRPPTARP